MRTHPRATRGGDCRICRSRSTMLQPPPMQGGSMSSGATAPTEGRCGPRSRSTASGGGASPHPRSRERPRQRRRPRRASSTSSADDRATDLAVTTLVLDLRTLRWSRLARDDSTRAPCGRLVGGRVYAIAGRRAGIDTNLRTVEALDPRTRRWQRVPSVPDDSRRNRSCRDRWTDRLGRRRGAGRHDPRRVVATTSAPAAGARLPDLPTPRHGLGVVALGGRVWAVAGGPRPGLTVSGAVESLPVP